MPTSYWEIDGGKVIDDIVDDQNRPTFDVESSAFSNPRPTPKKNIRSTFDFDFDSTWIRFAIFSLGKTIADDTILKIFVFRPVIILE